MGRINGWKRQRHYSNLENAENAIDGEGQVKIGIWTHAEASRIEHVYEPGAEKEFIVRIRNDKSFEEEGRYKYRHEGNQANKELMRKYP